MLRLEIQSHQEGKSVQLILSDSHTNLQDEILCAKLSLIVLEMVKLHVDRYLNVENSVKC